MLYIKYIFHCIITESYEVDVIFILKEKENGQRVERPREGDMENLRTFLYSSQWETGSFE